MELNVNKKLLLEGGQEKEEYSFARPFNATLGTLSGGYIGANMAAQHNMDKKADALQDSNNKQLATNKR